MADDGSKYSSWSFDGENEVWDEEKWEKELEKNEELMDKYKDVIEENPDKEWGDPLDLYYKVHYDLDFDKVSDLQEDEVCEFNEVRSYYEMEEDELGDIEDEIENELNGIEPYRLAKSFAVKIQKYVRKNFGLANSKGSNIGILLSNSIKIGTDIAGGHGLGYDKRTLCGNIVKCKWSLESTKVCLKILNELIINSGVSEVIMDLVELAQQLKYSIEFRIEQLRKDVWWM